MKRTFILLTTAVMAGALAVSAGEAFRGFRATDADGFRKYQLSTGISNHGSVIRKSARDYLLPVNHAMSRTDEISVDFSLVEPEKYVISLAVGINSQTGDIAYVADTETWGNPVALPSGTYKLFFLATGQEEPYASYVFGDESATLSENGTYLVDFSKCSELIDFRAFLPDGSTAKEPLTNMDSGQVLEEGTLAYGVWTLFFFIDDTLLDFYSGGMSRGIFDDGWSFDDETLGNVFVNPGLESISIVQYRQMLGSKKNKGIFYAAISANPAKGGIYSNTPSEYYHISNPFHTTIEGNVTEETYPVLYTAAVLGDTPVSKSIYSNTTGAWSSTHDYWFTDNNITSDQKLAFYFYPAAISTLGYEFSNSADDRLGIIANPVEIHDGKITYLATVNTLNSLSSLEVYNNFRYESNGKSNWVFNPAFTFSDVQKKIEDGNSVPILVAEQLWYNEEIAESDGLRNVLYHSYKGRNGEVRTEDLKGEVAKVSIEGVEQDISAYPTLSAYTRAKGQKRYGIWDIEITDNNCLVDDKKGYNYTKIHFNDKGTDVSAPTLQMLMTVDTDGNVTDRFNSPADGHIRIAGGDFSVNYNMAANREWFSVDECDIKVEYSARGENDWSELECKENHDGFMMPGWGYLWDVALAEIPVRSVETFYDLRITLTDHVDNFQQQILSPVFSISGGSGINTVEMDVTSSTNSRYYNLQGMLIKTPVKGQIYLESKGDGRVRKIMMK